MATSSSVICGWCDRQQVTNCAEYWCSECEEGLCSECYKYHSISKASKTHGCIPVDQYNQLPSSISEIAHHCKDHGIKYTNVCPTHDTICCPDCISTTHNQCEGFLSLKEIIKTAKTATLIDNMKQSLEDMESNINKVIQNREHNLSTIRQQRHKFSTDIKKFRDKINSKLDTLEHNLITELNAAESNIQTKIQGLLDRLSNERQSIQTLKRNIRTIKENASDLQIFLGRKTYQTDVEKAEKYMLSLSKDGSLKQFSLKCRTNDEIIQTLDTLTFGSISIETGLPSLVLKTEKDKQAQIMAVIPQSSPKSINEINLTLLHTYNIPKPGDWGYRGCIIHPSGKFILTDQYRSKLIILNDDGKVNTDIPCSSLVNDVTTIDVRTVAVSTVSGIDIINIDSKQTEKVIKTSNPCYGITHHKGTLLWCEESTGIQRANLSDGSINSLVNQSNLPWNCYVTTYGDKIYQTNDKTKTVTCYTMEGERLWQYTNGSVLEDPTGITVDNSGDIYVTSFNSDYVVVMTADGIEERQLLSQTDGLENPFGIYYDKTKNNVLIVNNGGPAFLYHVS